MRQSLSLCAPSTNPTHFKKALIRVKQRSLSFVYSKYTLQGNSSRLIFVRPSMIVANMATYPPRESALIDVLDSIAHQVDRLNLVLNQYTDVPDYIKSYPTVRPIIPDEDTKDVGKFYPDVKGAEYVVLIDDDIIYPSKYVERTLDIMDKIFLERFLGGYYASIYYRPQFALNLKILRRYLRAGRDQIAGFRHAFHSSAEVKTPLVVDQIGTGTAVLRTIDMPPYEYMRDSQKFVDVRLARWCFEQGITPVCLPRPQGWFPEGVGFNETIYRGFTKKNPPHVAREIWSYAFKNPNRGKVVEVRPTPEQG